MSVYSKGQQSIGKGGKMKHTERSTKSTKSMPHFGTKRIKSPPKDQNPGSFPK